MRNSLFLIILLLILVGCENTPVPEVPNIMTCEFNGEPRAFFCYYSKLGYKSYVRIEADDIQMRGTACRTPEDERKLKKWEDEIYNLATHACKSTVP